MDRKRSAAIPIAILVALIAAGCAVDLFDGKAPDLHRYYGAFADSGDQVVVIDEVYHQACPSLLNYGSCDTTGGGHKYRILSTTLAQPSRQKVLVNWTDGSSISVGAPQVLYLSALRNLLIREGWDGRIGVKTLVISGAEGGKPKVLGGLPHMLGQAWYNAVPSPDFRTLALDIQGEAWGTDWTNGRVLRIFLVDLAGRGIRDSVVFRPALWDTLSMGFRMVWEDDSTLIYYRSRDAVPDTGWVGYRIRGNRVTDTLPQVGCIGRITSSSNLDGKGRYLAFDSGLAVAREVPLSLEGCAGIR